MIQAQLLEEWEVLVCNLLSQADHTSCVAVVTLTERPVGPQALCIRTFWLLQWVTALL